LTKTTSGSSSLEHLLVPTNPEYDWTLPPDRNDTDFVNPVELNNKLVTYANEQIRIVQRIITLQDATAAAKYRRRVTDAALAKLRNSLLELYPPPTADRKSNVLVEAYLHRVAHQANKSREWQAALEAVDAAEAEVAEVEAQVESAKQVYYLLKDLVVNVQTHLSYRKHEQVQAR
jgi:predicted SprT family Zn-dependent metalloprotease